MGNYSMDSIRLIYYPFCLNTIFYGVAKYLPNRSGWRYHDLR